MTVPLYNLTDTWANAGTTFTAILMNVTNTASAAGSKLLSLQVSGAPQFDVDPSGNVFLPGASGGAANFGWGTGGGLATFLFNGSSDAGLIRVTFTGTANTFLGLVTNGFQVSAAGFFGWTASAFGSTQYDTAFARDAAGAIAQRNSTNAQTFRVYNTFTDASNYERGTFGWSGNVLVIGAEAAGTGTVRSWSLTTGGTINGNLQNTGYINGFSDVYTGNFAVAISNGGSNILAIGTGGGDASGTIKAKTKAGAFVAGDIPASTWICGRDTTNNTTKMYYNNAGALLAVALV